ncbi:MAG TPA: pyridoxal-phosphate dependent enzyme [Pseudoxanthomonas sp.]|jgi:threonine dehydratase|nr:pyridoxal-phosphate dependent enzyme [Pseudoxanthomonas sp.]
MPDIHPTFDDILAAAARIAPHAHTTPVLQSRELDAMAGCSLLFKAEPLQRGGAFKFRGACNAVWALPAELASRGVVTHSSGNHGAALALAAKTRGISCHVVAPDGAVATKLAAIARYGAVLHRCEANTAAREAACARLQSETGASLIHPFTDPHVIAGQGTAVLELHNTAGPLDAVITPVGGGGLLAGSTIAMASLAPACRVFGAEPLGADDTARSLAAGQRLPDFVPETICDGLRTPVGVPNFAVLQQHQVQVLVADDQETIAAMRLLWQCLKLLVEPSSAVAFASLLKQRERFAGQRVGVVLSGGNVDLDALPWSRA